MRTFRAVALFLCLLAHEAQASLFFTSEERGRIEHAFDRARPGLLGQARHVVHCSSILYSGPQVWTVWLQGERWTPETERPGLHILEVTPDFVRLSVALATDDAPRAVTLRAHQSLNLLTGAIVEGVY